MRIETVAILKNLMAIRALLIARGGVSAEHVSFQTRAHIRFVLAQAALETLGP